MLPDEKLSSVLGKERTHLIATLPAKHRKDEISIDRFLRMVTNEFFVNWRNTPPHWSEVYLAVESPLLCAYHRACIAKPDQVAAIELAVIGDQSPEKHFVVPDYAVDTAKLHAATHLAVMDTTRQTYPRAEYAVVTLDSMLEVAMHLYERAVALNVTSDDDVL